MEKKFYSRPTCKVVVLDTDDLICTSPYVNSYGGDTFEGTPLEGNGEGDSKAQSKGRSIWGED